MGGGGGNKSAGAPALTRLFSGGRGGDGQSTKAEEAEGCGSSWPHSEGPGEAPRGNAEGRPGEGESASRVKPGARGEGKGCGSREGHMALSLGCSRPRAHKGTL